MTGRRRIGVVGLGMAATPHARSLADLSGRVEVAGCFSPSAERRAAFSAATGFPAVGRLEELLDDPSVTAMLVMTPPGTHAGLIGLCAGAGKHVLLEKPLDATPEGARAAVSTIERAGLTLGVVFQHRFRPAAERLAGLLREGALGAPASAAISIRWWRGEDYFAQPGRGMRARDGGGVLLTQAIHMLDLFVSLLGLPEEVVAFAGTSALRRIDTEDVVAGALRHAGGLVASLDATTTAYPGFAERIDVAGELGSAVLTGDRLEVRFRSGRVLDEGGGGGTLGGGGDPMAFSHAHHRAVLADFLDALDRGGSPRVDGREALKVHRLIEALLEASATGRATRLPD